MVSIENLKLFLNVPTLGNSEDILLNKVSTLQKADENSLIWIKNTMSEKQNVINNTTARAIIVPDDDEIHEVGGKVLFKVKNPRLSFIKVIQEFFVTKTQPGIHPASYIHPEAVIGENVYIGPFTYIGKSNIGTNSVIHGNIYIYDQVSIGENVIVHSGSVIGADGFGYEKDENGIVFKFPHVGGVVIENDVEIGANTCIDRGSLGDTLIKRGAKIDNLVHIAHNVVIGENTFVIANAMIGGSTIIGNNSWVAPSVSLMNGISIGGDVTIGMSSLVTKSIPDGETYAGSPARPLRDFLDLQKKLKSL
jgi:UDP-3-O-[3-hydroxymyristoyl] glucosamine N-acyltransferase